jgi:hypothetical protein
MSGGNSSGGVESYLPIAAALAATIATDGAASPWLVDAMGATAAGAVTSGAAAAAASGLTAAVTGQDVGRSALMGATTGGIGGALSGYGAATGAGTEGIVGAGGTTPVAGAPLAGGNVAGNAAVMPNITLPDGSTFAGAPGLSGSSPSITLPDGSTFAGSPALSGPQALTDAQFNAAANTPIGGPAESGGIGGWLANNKGIAALGGTTALGYLINQDNKKYGTPATDTYEGPLTDFHYSRENYTPLTTAQPSPAYKPAYPNYKANPYNAYAATGAQGGVVAMANGGIAMANPSVNPVEQMSRDNSTGNNQMFPQAGINSPSFANATNRPMGTDMVADTSVDPYTGTQRFAEGGTTETQALRNIPNQITQNSVNTNTALTQDLVSRMAARNAVNPVPGQTPPVSQAPAGIMAAAPYAAPSFTRQAVPNIEFGNGALTIPGSSAYAAKQKADADAAAAAEAERQAAMYVPPTTYDGGFGGGAAGGVMPDALRYAHGGTAQSHLGGYSDGGRLLKGPGDGMSDNIPAQIGAKQPARLADGEFVVPADVVSHLGNGSTDAGAKKLYAMMDRVRAARTGTKKQGKQIKADKYLKV